MGSAEEKRVERRVGVGSARSAVLAGAHLLDRTFVGDGDILGDRATGRAYFRSVSLVFTVYRREYDCARTCERSAENGGILSVMKRHAA